jgi:hypothetical protein
MPSGIARARNRRRRFPVLLSVVAVAAFASAFAATPVRAGLPAPWEVHQEVREHVHDVLGHLGQIPARLHAHHRQHLQVFFGGHEYYAPHRHQHVLYRYPVWVGPEVYYRPYAYCGDVLFTQVAVRPHFWVDWAYPSHGGWCDHHRAYYPHAHSCFHGRGHGSHGSAGYYGRPHGARPYAGRPIMGRPQYQERRYVADRNGSYRDEARQSRERYDGRRGFPGAYNDERFDRDGGRDRVGRIDPGVRSVRGDRDRGNGREVRSSPSRGHGNGKATKARDTRGNGKAAQGHGKRGNGNGKSRKN